MVRCTSPTIDNLNIDTREGLHVQVPGALVVFSVDMLRSGDGGESNAP